MFNKEHKKRTDVGFRQNIVALDLQNACQKIPLFVDEKHLWAGQAVNSSVSF